MNVITPNCWVRFWDQFAKKRWRQKPEYLWITCLPLPTSRTFQLSVWFSFLTPTSFNFKRVGKADENTLDAKNHQTFNCNQCNFGAKSQKLGNLANMWFPPAAHKDIRAIPAHSMPRRPTQLQLHQQVHPRVLHEYPRFAHADVSLPYPALWMFLTPGPSFSTSISM